MITVTLRFTDEDYARVSDAYEYGRRENESREEIECHLWKVEQ